MIIHPKIFSKYRKHLLLAGASVGVILVVLLFGSTASIISSSNYSFHPASGTDLEGVNAKTVGIRISATQVVWDDYKINALSFKVSQVGGTWESEVIEGTGSVVIGTVVVPDNGDYTITLYVEIYFYDDKSFYTETHSSGFGVLDPDYAGAEDQEFYASEHLPLPADTPFPLIPIFIGLGALSILKVRKNEKKKL